MQVAQNINWWVVLGPTLISAFFVILTQVLLTFWLSRVTEGQKVALSKDLEDYKKNISKELETHRLRLQSEFQTRFYEFQTKYSLLHQRRADAIEKLFELLTDVQNDLQIWEAWENLPRPDSQQEFYEKSYERYQNLINFYDRKRIYFDDDVGTCVRAMVGTTGLLRSGYRSADSLRELPAEFVVQMKENAQNILNDNIHPLMNRLEARFKSILAVDWSKETVARDAGGRSNIEANEN
jgi:inosine/xanthosine triphosphate pyrophosphatase family protein